MLKQILIVILICCSWLGHGQVVEQNEVEKEEIKAAAAKAEFIEGEKNRSKVLEYNKLNKNNTIFNTQSKFKDYKAAQENYNKAQVLEKVMKAKRVDVEVKIQQLFLEEKKQEYKSITEDNSETRDGKLDSKTKEEQVAVVSADVGLGKAKAIIEDFDFENSRDRLTGPSQYDSRIEIRELSPRIPWQWLILRRNKSVGMLVLKDKLIKLADSVYQLDISSKLGERFNLCKKEAFRAQPIVGIGTTFIIGTEQLLTAQHVFQSPITDYAVVFGFELFNKNGTVETIIHQRDIYYPQIISKSFDGYDVVSYTVDRPIKRPVLQWETSSKLVKGTEVYMLGHPNGLPKKLAMNASIVNNAHPQYYYTTLDGFQGNSGSPVFNFNTHKVIGILVSGELDYKYNGSCYASTLCKIPYCKGEKVIRIERIINAIP